MSNGRDGGGHRGSTALNDSSAHDRHVGGSVVWGGHDGGYGGFGVGFEKMRCTGRGVARAPWRLDQLVSSLSRRARTKARSDDMNRASIGATSFAGSIFCLF